VTQTHRYSRLMTFGDPWTAEQQKLARISYDVWDRNHARWPNFDYVENEMHKQDLDAKAVLESFPVVGRVEINSLRYSDVAYDRPTAVWAGSQIGLTLAGLSKIGPERPHQSTYSCLFYRRPGRFVAQRYWTRSR
jgi:hypothetical protein